jgi:DNA-binding NtrC family response regulator
MFVHENPRPENADATVRERYSIIVNDSPLWKVGRFRLLSWQEGKQMADVLVVDDDQAICGLLTHVIGTLGHRVNCAYTLKSALDEASSGSYDVVFLDINLPDGIGLDRIQDFKQTRSAPEVIIITGLGGLDDPGIAIRNGARDYIQKSSSLKEITLSLMRALRDREEKKPPLPVLPLSSYLDQMESRYLQGLVTGTKGDITAACRISGLTRPELYALLKKHNIDVSKESDTGSS